MEEDQTNLALILDHVGDGVTVQDRQGRLIYANATAARSLGFASVADLLTASIPELVEQYSLFDEDGRSFPPERLPGRRALTGEQAPSATVRFRLNTTGEERWSIIQASPVRDASGNVLFAVNVWHDATAQKRTEAAQRFLAEAGEALATSLDVEATLAKIADLAVPRLADWCAVTLVREDRTPSQIAVAHVDPERVALARKLQERYPIDPDADQGVPLVMRTRQSQLVSEVTDEMLVAVARDAEHLETLRGAGLKSAIIVPMIAREEVLGAISFIAAESQHRFDQRDLELAEELARRAALAVDNARLYNAERAARVLAEEARARFRVLFEGVPDAILVTDATGRCVDVNPAASSLLGFSLTELLAMHVRDLFPDQQIADAQFLAQQEQADGPAETTAQRRDGALLPVEIWSRRIDLPAGPIVLAVVRDISDRITADAIREEVLSAISHDLRNPLGSIKLSAQTLQRVLQRGNVPEPARLESTLAAVDAMATRATFLLDDINDVVRSRGREGVPFTPQNTELVALVRRCAAEAEAVAGRAVEVEATTESLVIRGDPHALERVFHNLIHNALKYSPGGGDVVVRVGPARNDPELVEVMVEDTGMGIPAVDLPHVFEPYRRGQNVGRISGTGLGLTGVKQVVDRHGGTIEITSTEGRGTTVTVRLPFTLPATV